MSSMVLELVEKYYKHYPKEHMEILWKLRGMSVETLLFEDKELFEAVKKTLLRITMRGMIDLVKFGIKVSS